MSAPTVERSSPEVSPGEPRLPWHLRLLAAIGRLLLRVRRGLRVFGHRIARGVQWLGRSPLVAGPTAALSVALVGLAVIALPVAGAWWGGVEPAGSWQDAASVTGSVWVMSYGVPVRLTGIDYSLIPWGLVILTAWLGHQAGRWLVRVSNPSRWSSLLAGWLIATLLGAGLVVMVSVAADIPAVQTSARKAAVSATVILAVAIGSGMWRASELIRSGTARLPVAVPIVLRASTVHLAALFGFASVLLLVAVTSSFGDIANMFSALEPTFSDAIVVSLLSLAYLPTMLVWAMAYMLGAGISLGPEILLSPFVAALPPTPLPVFPPLAALPETAAPLVWAFPVLTVLAGGLGGLAVSRYAARESLLVRMVLALSSVVVAVAGVYLVMLAGTGSLGDGRLMIIGPDPALAALLAGVGLTVGALPTSILRAERRQRRLQPVGSTPQDADVPESSGRE